jgi:hypothetical protein
LPGDNRYECIDNYYKNDINGLVATHYGGACDKSKGNNIKKIQLNKYNGKIVYSYGKNNKEKHPSYDKDYAAQSWTTRLDTINGRCALSVKYTTHLPFGGRCDLKIIQL